VCGICGIVDLEGASALDLVTPMADTLRHRGPDALGVLDDHTSAPSIALGHRRLSIIDLSEAANQPLANDAGTIWAALNGEIYNFQELRRELESKYHFRTTGDTEVIVHGYTEWGEDVVARLDGQFVFALWDKGKRRLLLARDRFGKKPLYWCREGKRVFFASEIKGLLAAGYLGSFLTLSNTSSSVFVKELGDAARGVIVTQVFPAPDTSSDFQKLAAEYNLSKSYTAMEGYVYARVLVEAIRRTGPRLSRQSLTETLESGKKFDLGGYVISFDPRNRTGSTAVDLTMITKNGRFMR